MIDYTHAKIKSKKELKKYIKNYVRQLDVDRIKSIDETHLIIPYINDEITILLVGWMREELIDMGIFNKIKIVITRDTKKVHQDVLSAIYGY
ncbi:MAG: hypothetical protein ACK5LC_14890 [Coprobacillaceae bacterium]